MRTNTAGPQVSKDVWTAESVSLQGTGVTFELPGGAKQDERLPNGFVFCLFALVMLIGSRVLSPCLRNFTASNSR